MFKALRFLFIASAIALFVAWFLDHNGSIIISWLGYEVRTDILTAILLTIFFTLIVFVTSYAIAKIRSIKLPRFSKKFNQKNDSII
jgi:uncharacterized membrane-anchored protein